MLLRFLGCGNFATIAITENTEESAENSEASVEFSVRSAINAITETLNSPQNHRMDYNRSFTLKLINITIIVKANTTAKILHGAARKNISLLKTGPFSESDSLRVAI